MIIDFCHHSIHSKVKADKVSFDGYEVQNLTENNIELKRKGFLSDHFVKPPVNITVHLPCNISIYRIVINPVIGQQKSCDIKIFTATERVTESWLYCEDKGRLSVDGVRFNCVGHIYQAEPVTVCFDNPLFKERHGWTVGDVPTRRSYPVSAAMNARRFGGLSDVSHVTVCVSRTKGAKSVAIKTLEIWGIPSSKVPQSVQQTLSSAYSKTMLAKTTEEDKSRSVSKPDSRNNSDAHCMLQQENLFEKNGVAIPDDFIDQITCDIMTIPVLLPCGKNIDQTTLERHVNSEASWGRSPSDPFTGVLFSKGVSPVTNTSLKARIDQFVFQHSDLLKVPQTLGRSNRHKINNTAGVISKLVDKPRTVSHDNKHDPLKVEKDVSCNTEKSLDRNTENKILSDSSKSLQLSVCRKRKTLSCHIESKKKKMDPVECSTSKEDDVTVLGYTSAPPTGHSSFDHDSDLSRSLDSALLSTLSCLPSFTSSKKLETSQDISIKQCSKCASDLTMDNVIKYRLVCQHFVCRECLIKVRKATRLICGVCFSSCYPNDVVRVF